MCQKGASMSRYKDCGGGRALLRLFEFTLGSTDGKDTADGIFEICFGLDLQKSGVVFGTVTPETDLVVDEIIIDEDSKFANLIHTAVEFERSRLTGSQFLSVCKRYRHRLQKEGISNFFILTKGDEPVAEDLSNIFVVSVMVLMHGILAVYPRHLANVLVWCGDDGFRLFSRKQ